MTTTPSTRFSKKNWLNFHHNHCSKLAKYTFETILIGDSIVAGLSRYQNVWNKFLNPLKALNCGIGGDRTEHALWRALNLPVFSRLKDIVVLCGTNNLPLDSPKDISLKNYTADYDKEVLKQIDFPNYENFSDVNEAYSNFFHKLMTVIDKITPYKSKRVKGNGLMARCWRN